jgi:hypothetical protein
LGAINTLFYQGRRVLRLLLGPIDAGELSMAEEAAHSGTILFDGNANQDELRVAPDNSCRFAMQ